MSAFPAFVVTRPGNPPDPPASSPAPSAPARFRRRRARRRFWLMLMLAILASLALSPLPWQHALRALLTWEAKRRGWELQIGVVQGGLFDALTLYDVHGQRRLPPSSPETGPQGGADLYISRVEAVLAWRFPFLQPPAPSWINRLTLDGVQTWLDFPAVAVDLPQSAAVPTASPSPGILPSPLPWLATHCVPMDFEALRVNCQIQRGTLIFQTREARLTAYHDGPGQFLARTVGISGPGFENALLDRHSQTFWKENRLTLTDLSLGRGVDLVRVTLDGSNLRQRQLRWDGDLRALDGSIRSQGTVGFSRGRLMLDTGNALQEVAVRPLAKLLGLEGPADGRIGHGHFDFRGDPEHWTAATITLVGDATDFRWRQRRWQSLEWSAVVSNRRVQVQKLELRQSRNQLSLSGECALPSNESGAVAAWQQAGFSCNIDAKLDDLHALAELLGPGLPPVEGRMSVNGTLTTRSPGPGFDGYLNVEGSALSILGAPLDFLRSTLIFRGEELQVADFQATHATDYFTGKGTFKIVGPLRYQAELRAAVDDLSVYHPAYAGAITPQLLAGSLRLEWSGDGAPGAHSGAFRGSVEKFFAKTGSAALSRPVNLEADGTYSPVSLSFRRLALKEGEGDKRRDALSLEGAIPWRQDFQALAVGQWAASDQPIALLVKCDDAPLDLLAAALAPAQAISAAEGQVGGWLKLEGPARAPRSDGVLQFRKAAARWTDPTAPPLEAITADIRLEDSVLRLNKCELSRAGDDYQLGGSVDLHDPSAPILDLSAQSRHVTALLDNDFLRADAEMALQVRGPVKEATVSGEVRLLGGVFYRRLELSPSAESLDQSPLPVEQWLPRALLNHPLDLHIASAKPLRILARGNVGGEAEPDLALTGTGRAPALTGKMEFRDTLLIPTLGKVAVTPAGNIEFCDATLNLSLGELPVKSGMLYFTAGQPDSPTIAIPVIISTTRPIPSSFLTPAHGKRGAADPIRAEIYFYGPAKEARAVSWDASLETTSHSYADLWLDKPADIMWNAPFVLPATEIRAEKSASWLETGPKLPAPEPTFTLRLL